MIFLIRCTMLNFLTQSFVLKQHPWILFQGDILFLHMSRDPIRAGEIVVFNVDVSTLTYGL